MSADHKPSADADSPAHAGAGDDAEHDIVVRGCAVCCLGKHKAVGIIRHANRPPEHPGEILVERAPVEEGRVGVLHEAGIRTDGAGNGDANGAATAESLLAHQYKICDNS